MTTLLSTRQNMPNSFSPFLIPSISIYSSQQRTPINKILPFLDTLFSVGPSSLLVTTVYRNSTHKDQYLHWYSHHSISAKYSVVNTLTQRVQTVCSDQQLLGQEQLHIRTPLSRCNYPDWVFNRLQTKLDFQPSHQDHSTNSNTQGLGQQDQKHLNSGSLLKRT